MVIKYPTSLAKRARIRDGGANSARLVQNFGYHTPMCMNTDYTTKEFKGTWLAKIQTFHPLKKSFVFTNFKHLWSIFAQISFNPFYFFTHFLHLCSQNSGIFHGILKTILHDSIDNVLDLSDEYQGLSVQRFRPIDHRLTFWHNTLIKRYYGFNVCPNVIIKRPNVYAKGVRIMECKGQGLIRALLAYKIGHCMPACMITRYKI